MATTPIFLPGKFHGRRSLAGRQAIVHEVKKCQTQLSTPPRGGAEKDAGSPRSRPCLAVLGCRTRGRDSSARSHLAGVKEMRSGFRGFPGLKMQGRGPNSVEGGAAGRLDGGREPTRQRSS